MSKNIGTMSQSHAFLLAHIIFSTKDRARLLSAEIRESLHPYMATVVRNTGCECYGVGGIADHVHIAVRLARTVTAAELVKDLKTSSSQWLKTKSPRLTHFAWQRGYGAFSVGPTDLDALRKYISAQEAHHRKRSFQEEYRAFLEKYGVDFDERYMWD